VGGFASGCHRTEYRINGGPLTSHVQSIELPEPGTYVVEFRSIDGAANEEPFNRGLYGACAAGRRWDGLSDAYELFIGTNPNNPDTDGDGLRDDAELARGTNPLVGDTDADGLSDGTEVSLGTNPLVTDTDGDGLSDGQEVAAGLDPLVADMDGDTHLDGADNCRRCGTGPVRFRLRRQGGALRQLPRCGGRQPGGRGRRRRGDACDCAPGDPLVRAPASPSIVASKTGGSTIELSWPPWRVRTTTP